jgi:thiol:disulfide interchange protein DsbD
VATTLDWKLPQGFTAGKIQWPAPEKVNMAGIVANGYRSRVVLLTEITPPDEIHGEQVEIRAKAAWMACAQSCHPGYGDLSLSIPVNQSGKPVAKDARLAELIAQVRKSIPRPAPSSWKVSVKSLAADRIGLDVFIPGLQPEAASSVVFYCDDLQVDSDQKMDASLLHEGTDTLLRLGFVRPGCAPRSPVRISGVLHCPAGWPGIDATHVEISVPWPAAAAPSR